MDTFTVTQKAQIATPAALRRKLGFEPGTKVIVTEEPDGSVRVRPATRSYFEQFAGMLSESEASATEVLLEERARDRDREDARWSSGTDGTGT